MRNQRNLGIIFVALGVSVASPVKAGNAETKKACVAAADKGQELRSDGKLSAAREQFVRCSKDECPSQVRQDCAQWMNEVVAALPSVVVGARDASGHDLMHVSVTIDGVKVADTLDGKPIPVDPGQHKLRYEQSDGSFVEDDVLIRQGEKNRALTANFGKPKDSGASAPSDHDATPTKPKVIPAPHAEESSTPAMAWILGGVGVVALGTAAYFDLSANSRVLDLRNSCAPNCAQSDVDAVRRRYTIAGVAAGVGVVSLGVATYLFLHKSSTNEAPPSAARFHFDLAPAPHGAHAAISGSF